MKTRKLQTISFFLSLFLYNYFFWKEGLGINLFIFSLLIIIILIINYRDSFRSPNVQLTFSGTVLTAIMVVIFNSAEAKFAHMFSFLLMVAFIHESQLRSVTFAFLHMVSGLYKVPLDIYRRKNRELQKFPRINFLFRIVRLSFIPLCVAFIFYILYAIANPIFGDYAGRLWKNFIDVINSFFENISFARMMFILMGAIILSVVFFRNETRIFLDCDLSFSEKLSRIRNTRRNKPAAFSSITRQPIYAASVPLFRSIALKNQNRRGVILLILVNVLLLAENIIDIRWLWFGFSLPEGFSLQHYVREGTGFLIASILLSMGLLLYYFRKNQNFYQKNKLLKSWAYVWIFQNVILCFSVFLRNYHYIDFHGLAYKRIGVDVFLILTVFGLMTLYYKIKEVKSVYYLIKINTWAMYVILVGLSCYNWDVKIADYNLAHWNKGEVDVDFYQDLSDKALPSIYANLDLVKEQIEAHGHNKVRWIAYLDYNDFKTDLDHKRDNFLKRYENHSWLSFNMQDKRAFQELAGRELSEMSER